MKNLKIYNTLSIITFFILFIVYWFYLYVLADDMAMYVVDKGLFTSYQEFQALITISIFSSLLLAIMITAVFIILWLKTKKIYNCLIIIHIPWLSYMLYKTLTSEKYFPIIHIQL